MRRLGIALVLCGGCGFLPQPERTGRPIHDGVAPWADVGALALCRAGARLGPPGGPTGGFCAPDTAPAPVACSIDAECDLASYEACVCGRCRVPFCAGNEDCPAGLGCVASLSRCAPSCGGAVQCPQGFGCDGGGCVRRCARDADCLRGEVCSSLRGNVCFAPACGGAVSCGAGQHCELELDTADLHEPSLLARPGELLLYIELRETGASSILRARSTDGGASFVVEPETPVLVASQPFEGGRVASPAAVRRGAEILLYYEAGAAGAPTVLGRARSTDGVTFVADPAPWAAPAEAWEASGLTSPSAAVEPESADAVLVAYASADGSGIGLLRDPVDPPEAPPVRVSSSSVLAPGAVADPDLWVSVDRVAQPDLVIDSTALGDPRVRLYFAARGAEAADVVLGTDRYPAPINWSLGYADAGLALAFVTFPFNPIFSRATFTTFGNESEPAVGLGGASSRLYYAASRLELQMTAMGVRYVEVPEGLRVAVNPPETR